MTEVNQIGFRSMESFDVEGRFVLLRLDINSPLNPSTKKIVSENRINKSVPTLNWLLNRGARVAVIAHQGDTLDYQNLIPLNEHAEILSEKTGRSISYIDDVCGPAAQQAVRSLNEGEAVILGNLRYLAEEISTFEDAVKLSAEAGASTWLVRSLAPLFDLYINDAFAAAHRNAPSMVSFQRVLPSGAGPLFYSEITALSRVMKAPVQPSVFLLGGAKISDAFGMMDKVLEDGIADLILTTGVTGLVFLEASGIDTGVTVRDFMDERGLTPFIGQAKELLNAFPGKIQMPLDLAYEADGLRREVESSALPDDESCNGAMLMDIGAATIIGYSEILESAGTIFINGPAGVFEESLFEEGTRKLWQAAAASNAYSVVGGGDSVSAAGRFCGDADFSYICTAGGAMVRFVSGKKLPLIEAMENRSE